MASCLICRIAVLSLGPRSRQTVACVPLPVYRDSPTTCLSSSPGTPPLGQVCSGQVTHSSVCSGSAQGSTGRARGIGGLERILVGVRLGRCLVASGLACWGQPGCLAGQWLWRVWPWCRCVLVAIVVMGVMRQQVGTAAFPELGWQRLKTAVGDEEAQVWKAGGRVWGGPRVPTG